MGIWSLAISGGRFSGLARSVIDRSFRAGFPGKFRGGARFSGLLEQGFSLNPIRWSRASLMRTARASREPLGN